MQWFHNNFCGLKIGRGGDDRRREAGRPLIILAVTHFWLENSPKCPSRSKRIRVHRDKIRRAKCDMRGGISQSLYLTRDDAFWSWYFEKSYWRKCCSGRKCEWSAWQNQEVETKKTWKEHQSFYDGNTFQGSSPVTGSVWSDLCDSLKALACLLYMQLSLLSVHLKKNTWSKNT